MQHRLTGRNTAAALVYSKRARSPLPLLLRYLALDLVVAVTTLAMEIFAQVSAADASSSNATA